AGGARIRGGGSFLGGRRRDSPGLVPLYGADAGPSFSKRGSGFRPPAYCAWASTVQLRRAADIAHLRGAHRRPFSRPAKSSRAWSGHDNAAHLRRAGCRGCGCGLRHLLLNALARLTHSRRHRDARSRFPMGRAFWGANAPLGALIACLIVGTLVTPIAN